MNPTPDSCPLPEKMKSPGLCPPPSRPSRLCVLPAWCAGACYVFWLAFALVFEPYPEYTGHWWSGVLMGPLFVLGAVSFGLGLILSGMAAISAHARERNILVLILCLLAPLVSLAVLALVN